MNMFRPVGHACAAASLTLASASFAAGTPAPPVAAPQATAAPAKVNPGSVYVRCDGNPDNITAGETLARVVAITALVGLFMPQHEAPNLSRRLTGADGVAACSAALEKESNATRRVQLILARA